jgi:hypothetical protein
MNKKKLLLIHVAIANFKQFEQTIQKEQSRIDEKLLDDELRSEVARITKAMFSRKT